MSENNGTIGGPSVEDFVRTEVSRSFPARPSSGLYTLAKDAILTGEQAVERLPASIRIGPYSVAIERMSAVEASARNRAGEFSGRAEKIWISVNLPSSTQVVDTFIHEVLHGIWWVSSLEDGDKEERIVCVTAVTLTGLLRDNLWLLDWLKECLR